MSQNNRPTKSLIPRLFGINKLAVATIISAGIGLAFSKDKIQNYINLDYFEENLKNNQIAKYFSNNQKSIQNDGKHLSLENLQKFSSKEELEPKMLDLVKESVREAEDSVRSANTECVALHEAYKDIIFPNDECVNNQDLSLVLIKRKKSHQNAALNASEKLKAARICFDNFYSKFFDSNEGGHISQLDNRLTHIEQSFNENSYIDSNLEKLSHLSQEARKYLTTALNNTKPLSDDNCLLEESQQLLLDLQIKKLHNECTLESTISKQLLQNAQSILNDRAKLLDDHIDRENNMFDRQKTILIEKADRKFKKHLAHRIEKIERSASNRLTNRLEHDEIKLKQQGDLYLKEQASKRAQLYETELNLRDDLINRATSLNKERLCLKTEAADCVKLAGICSRGIKSLNNDKKDFLLSMRELTAMSGSVPDLELILRNICGGDVSTFREVEESFWGVSRASWRVASLRDKFGLFEYLFCVLESMFVMENVVGIENVREGDMFGYIGVARECMRRGDIEGAVRLMRNLRGEAGVVAASWVERAVKMLEVRQALSFVNAYARMSVDSII